MKQHARHLIIGLALVAAACSSGSEAATTSTPTTLPTTTTSTTAAPTTTVSTTTTTMAPEVSPLNGLPVTSEENAARRVLAVKIDNHCNARPQSGLDQADAVYELKVESFFTRFIALFHDNDTDFIGPIRSGRPTDPTLLRPLGATFSISGGQPWVLDLIANDGVRMLGEGPGMFRVSFRVAPHNLYGDTTALRAEADRRGYPNDPPPELFSFGDFAGTEEATEIQLSWDKGNEVIWTWDGERYVRSVGGGSAGCRDDGPSLQQTQEGVTSPITADTVVVLFGDFYTARPASGSGTPVPATETVGEGRALVFAGGKMQEGTWERAQIEDVVRLLDADGNEMLVPPGMPWISFIDPDRPVTWS